MKSISKKFLLTLLTVAILVVTCSCELVKAPDFYELNGDDVIPSFTKVVGSRSVNSKKMNMTNALQSISFSYKKIEDAYKDAETYLDYLTGEEGFTYSGVLSMDEKSDEITLSKPSSTDNTYEVRIIIRYNVEMKTVKITAEREKLLE